MLLQEHPLTSVQQEHQRLAFTPAQAAFLYQGANRIAELGGPEIAGAASEAQTESDRLYRLLDAHQQNMVQQYADGQLALLECFNMQPPQSDTLPPELPALEALEHVPECLHLAARNQILLHLVRNRAFAYDIDNNGRLVRFVGNFCGGGLAPRKDEPAIDDIELSSHAGLSLGPHTEAPYHCALQTVDGRSPAPSTLILTARWNPQEEPTSVIPMMPIIDNIGAKAALALTSPSFDYTRSDSFVSGAGSNGNGVSILQFDRQGVFALRYNSYRHSLNKDACPAAKEAFNKLSTHVRESKVIKSILTPSRAVLINNNRALHCRDVVRDNRRLLIRMFGYSRFVEPAILNVDPLTVKG